MVTPMICWQFYAAAKTYTHPGTHLIIVCQLLALSYFGLGVDANLASAVLLKDLGVAIWVTAVVYEAGLTTTNCGISNPFLVNPAVGWGGVG